MIKTVHDCALAFGERVISATKFLEPIGQQHFIYNSATMPGIGRTLLFEIWLRGALLSELSSVVSLMEKANRNAPTLPQADSQNLNSHVEQQFSGSQLTLSWND